MKKILLILILSILQVVAFGQSKELPKFYIVNNDTLGIILSMKQMKKIKNDLELKSYFEASAISCDSFVSKSIIVIDDCEKRVRSLKIRLTKLDSLNDQNDSLLNNCLTRLKNGEKNNFLCDSQRTNDSIQISNLNKQINTLKFEKLVGWWGSGTLLVTSIILAIILAVH